MFNYSNYFKKITYLHIFKLNNTLDMPRTAGDLLGSPYFSFEIASMHARYLTAGRDFFCLQLKYIYI